MKSNFEASNTREVLRSQRQNFPTSMVQPWVRAQRDSGIPILGDNLICLCGDTCLEQAVGLGTFRDAFQSKFL